MDAEGSLAADPAGVTMPGDRVAFGVDSTKEPPPERLRGHDPLTETDPRGPAGEVMGDDLHREPGAIGGEPA